MCVAAAQEAVESVVSLVAGLAQPYVVLQHPAVVDAAKSGRGGNDVVAADSTSSQRRRGVAGVLATDAPRRRRRAVASPTYSPQTLHVVAAASRRR